MRPSYLVCLSTAAVVVGFAFVAPAEASGGGIPTPGVEKVTEMGTTIPSTNPRQDKFILTESQYAAILARYPDVAGSTAWNSDTGTAIQNVVGRVDDSSSSAHRLAQDLRAAEFPYAIQFASIPRPPAELEAGLEHLVATLPVWAKGLHGYGYAEAVEADGGLRIGVDQRYAAAWQERISATSFDVPVSIRSEPVVGVIYESRNDDYAPWTGGLSLNAPYFSGPTPGTQNVCTGGFTWKQWAGGALVASTAEHCINSPTSGNTYRPWRNNGTLVGDVILTSPASDSALLKSPGSSYSGTVFLGAPNSTLVRPVVSAAATDTIGEDVALSGRISGGPISKVLAKGISVGATTVTVLEHDVSAGGDSGGPWLQTVTSMGNGARAKGQHLGKVAYGGQFRSAYVPVTRISSYLHASIYIP